MICDTISVEALKWLWGADIAASIYLGPAVEYTGPLWVLVHVTTTLNLVICVTWLSLAVSTTHPSPHSSHSPPYLHYHKIDALL